VTCKVGWGCTPPLLYTRSTLQLQQQIRQSRSLEDVLITAHSQTQLYLSEHLSTLNPELTIQIFSGKFSLYIYSTYIRIV